MRRPISFDRVRNEPNRLAGDVAQLRNALAFVGELSPGADFRDAYLYGGQAMNALGRGDLWEAAQTGALGSAALGAIFLPGSVGAADNVLRAAEDGRRGGVWFHGTPDRREVADAGGFAPRVTRTRIISDPEKRATLRQQMKNVEYGSDDYFNILDKMKETVEYKEFAAPVFMVDRPEVAKTYADPSRAFDFQGAVPDVYQITSKSENILKINALGEKFDGIGVDAVKQSLLGAGIDPASVDAALARHADGIQRGVMRTDDLSAIAQEFGFDTVDVLNVRDNYNSRGRPATVRMVFDPGRIEFLKKLGIGAAVAGGAYALTADEYAMAEQMLRPTTTIQDEQGRPANVFSPGYAE